MSVKTPNYFLTEAYTFYPNGWGGEGRALPEGASVRPLHSAYVPKHVLEDKRWDGFNKDSEVFCYTRFGIIAIPKKIIREK